MLTARSLSSRPSPRLPSRPRGGRRSGASTAAAFLVRRRGLRLWHHARIRLRDGRGAGGASARSQRAPHRSPVCTDVDGEEVAGSHAWAAWSGSVLSSCLLCDAVGRGVLAFGRGQKQRAQLHPRGRPGGGLGGAMCMPRGRGRRPRAVARSQTCEDHTTTPRWRARARIVLSRRGRLVSGFGQKKEKSTTCEPSTLRRGAWSRPPHRQRSACTSSPRRARTRH